MSCLTCPRRFVGGGGNPSSPLVCLGTAPGKNDKEGRPFTGYAARDFDYVILPRSGMQRHEIFMTNIVGCYWEDQSKIPDDLARRCARKHVPSAIKNAEVVAAMGARVCNLLGINIEREHGIPRYMEIPEWNWEGIVVPTLHPAQTSHDPKVIGQLLNDFTAIKRALAGDYATAVEDEYPNPICAEATGKFRAGRPDHSPVAIDCEWDESDPAMTPISIQYALGPNAGFLIWAHEHEKLAAFNEFLNSGKFKILMHNQNEDINMAARMGICIPQRRVIDTMQMSYHQCDLPQGLKDLARQLLGAKTTEYDELVKPYYHGAILDYLERAISQSYPDIEKVSKTGKARLSKNPIVKKLKTIAEGDPLDAGKKLTNIKERPLMEQLLGPLPVKSLLLVPKQELIEYACKDAIYTWRLYPVLRSRRFEKMF